VTLAQIKSDPRLHDMALIRQSRLSVMPVEKKAGDEAIGATINKNGLLRIRATKVGKDTFLSQVIKLVGDLVASLGETFESSYLLGLAYFQAGNFQLAYKHFEQATRLNSQSSMAFYYLGFLAHKGRDFQQAVEKLQQAINLDAENKQAYLQLGTTFRRLGRHLEALKLYRAFVDRNTGSIEGIFGLAFTLQELGYLVEAEKTFREILQLSPDSAIALGSLTYLTKNTQYTDEIRHMEELYRRSSTDTLSRVSLGFGLGKAYEDMGRDKDAFMFWSEANKLKRSTYQYSIDERVDFFNRIKNVFTTDLFSRFKGFGLEDKTPIFILGMPRSGTSLVEQILASHPQVHGAGELEYLQEACGLVESRLNKPFPEVFDGIGKKNIEGFGRAYLAKLLSHQEDNKEFIVDKMPQNFRYIGLISLVFPNAKIIHCQRDPIDICLSLYKHLFQGLQPYTYDLTELGQYYGMYSDLMEHWSQVLPGKVYNIRYEDLVAEPQGKIRELLTYCDLEFAPQCLSFHQTKRSVSTASLTQVRQPIYSNSVKAWKRYEAELQPLIKSLRQSGVNC
jgi:tetratricopeptide (TPR) repeat protein